MSELSRGRIMALMVVAIIMVLALVLIQGYMNRTNNDDITLIYEVNIGFNLEANNAVSIDCQVADTQEERQTGLMYITSLPEDDGMLFVLGEPRNVSMWMKNVEIPLDMIFVDENLRVVNIEEASIELPDTPDSEMTRYHSDLPVIYVIEANRGFCSTHGIEPGTEVSLTFS